MAAIKFTLDEVFQWQDCFILKTKATVKMRKPLAASIFSIVLIAGCIMTTTKAKTPVFSKQTDSLQMDLSKIVSCENVNLNGKEISKGGKVSSELEIDITNGESIPTDENQMITLGKQIAAEIKGALQDKNEFQTYKVLFIKKTENAGVTETTWKGKIFKSEEL